MQPRKDRMTGLEKAMRIRKEFATLSACGMPSTTRFSSMRFALVAREGLIRVVALCSCVAVGLGLSGCGASATKPQVGAITATDVNGVPQPSVKTLTAGSGTYLDVTLTSDKSLLGADWTVSCGSALPPGTPLPPGQTVDTSCGYFTPIHTMSAPVPDYVQSAEGIVTYYAAPAAPPKSGTVTLYASSSADHSRFSSLTLVIQGQPISVGIVASTAPPFSLPVNEIMSLTGTLSNDYTVGGGSINWTLTCQSSDCGSLSAAKTTNGTPITFTAPAAIPTGDTVTVTATSVTDPSVSNSIVITIT